MSIFNNLKTSMQNMFVQKINVRQPPSRHYSNNRFISRIANEKSIISSIFNRIEVDVSNHKIKHILLEDDIYVEDVNSALNQALTISSNIDQIPRALIQEVASTLLNKGVAALVPTDYIVDDTDNSILIDVMSLRCGYITEWFPLHVRVDVYNEKTGQRQEIIMEKREVAIIENPLAEITSSQSSALQRLIQKLRVLDSMDNEMLANKFNMIIQVPYAVRGEASKARVEERATALEEQLATSTHGIAYTDATEKITQLNRPFENNLLQQIEYLHRQVFTQLGITEEVLNGTAPEKAMQMYKNRIVSPIINSITESALATFVNAERRMNGETLRAFSDLISGADLNTMIAFGDSTNKNATVSANEYRTLIGYKKKDSVEADALINKNINPVGTGEEGEY